MAFIVRDPRIVDFDELNALGQWFQENSLYAECGWSEQKAFALLLAGIDPESKTFMRILEKDGQLIGFFLGHVSEYFFSNKKIAQEMAVVVHPGFRAEIYKPMLRLLKDFVDWAGAKGAHEVCIGITSGIAGPGYEKLLKRVGFNEVGTILKMRC